ncbi:helix-turn-helix domain-containing protein [Mucilaginibacter sp.]|uniref:helix-turn-helix domain-containing protein n=1 Tax=Mucilaginibacter sp. TaxID=1882438 RepID=UPI0026045CFF|nr:helix-turn-helix domain-containing protein [Mucilaginibacter sp.]MDB5127310.1 helix-turn-helix protein [Mucilaginibacter sp.]
MERIPIRHIHTSQKEPDLSESFSIRDISGLLAGKDMVQELHRHDFFYILALKNATGDHEIDFTPYTIGDNSVFFMRPGQVHQLVLKAESTGYLMQFKAEFYSLQDKIFSQLLRKTSQINHYQLTATDFLKLRSILTYIFQEYAEKKERFEEVIKANMNIFFIELARQQGSSPSDQASLYMQERLEKFLGLLETHVFTHKQVAQYAAMLHLSAYQLNAMAKAALGKTCAELITEHIILEAKRCLLATSNQINQTAYRLGYEDVSYFIRFFKKHTGYSPEAFRNNFG